MLGYRDRRESARPPARRSVLAAARRRRVFVARRQTERRQRDDVGHDCHDDDLPGQSRPRGQRPRLGTRPRDEPVGCVRLCEARLDVRRDPGALLPGHDARACAALERAGTGRPEGEHDDRVDDTVEDHRRYGHEDAARTRSLDAEARSSALKGKALLPPLAFVGEAAARRRRQAVSRASRRHLGRQARAGGRRRSRSSRI